MSEKNKLVQLNKRVSSLRSELAELTGLRKALALRLKKIGVNNLESARDHLKDLKRTHKKILAKRIDLEQKILRKLEKVEI